MLDNIEFAHERSGYCWKEFDSLSRETLFTECYIVTLRPPNDHQLLKAMAQVRGVSLNKLFETLTARALTEHDIELRYRRLTLSGSEKRGIELLDKLQGLDAEH